MIAGLVTAMCEFSMGAISLPVATVELEDTCLSLVELPVDDLHRDKEFLRAVVFHDSSDGPSYGHVLGLELLTMFKAEYGERLLNMQLGNEEYVEHVFKPFNAKVRTAVISSVKPLMRALEAEPGVKQVFLLQHNPDDTFSKSLYRIWYSSSPVGGGTLLADLQALLSAGDDVLAKQGDESSVITLGNNVRIERLEAATMLVLTHPSSSCASVQNAIISCTRVLANLFSLMRGLKGSHGQH
ncbi:hypothetical protein BWQ96_06913 [Gracilariopsis chorda]|uniref:Uncharacterized protein n=1 Tax=Gracilariopsis chorda TaxID=448386 RepID=A0A2V3IQD1_9FLOR|nr:hypothetical protein BWQ96_06913 [Gracilariopsis chorda]|eukprot:PXF43350.1 hypothetical protein BWQ96_06913 [Gracilariopsis chorda]